MNAIINKGLSNMRRQRRLLLIAGPALLVLVAAFFYLAGGRYVSTDDAYVRVARTDVSPSVSGRVVEIEVKDSQHVRKGDVLFKLDDRDFKVAVSDAKAKLADAKIQIAAAKATHLQRQADVKEAEDTLVYAGREFKRQKMLAAQGIASRSQLDKAQNALQTAEQKRDAAIQAQANALAMLGGDADIDVNDHPMVRQAQAALDRAELNLSYTIIKAPIDGVTAKVDQLEVGDYINASVPVFSLMSDKDIWVEANFKETDLTYMRPGQDADITVDTYPGKTFHGKVVSLSAGTGSSFSLLPPENASGNWVKVVQRLPVRISIEDRDPNYPLNSGLSANVDVDTHHSRL